MQGYLPKKSDSGSGYSEGGDFYALILRGAMLLL